MLRRFSVNYFYPALALYGIEVCTDETKGSGFTKISPVRRPMDMEPKVKDFGQRGNVDMV